MTKDGLVRALVTGAAGFAGSHLIDYLIANTPWDLYAFVWERANLEHLARHERVHVLKGDIVNESSIHEAVMQAQPDHVFHLAAVASVPQAYQNPGPTMMTNILGQVNLLQALVHLNPMPRTLVIGSADEYGLVSRGDLPITENTLMRPANPYAVSKITQDMMGHQYFRTHGLPVVRVRPFNHIGPRQRESFVAPAFAKQIAEAEAGLRDPVLRVGNLEARRDFSDVRDIVRGYHLAVTLGEPGEVYNMASERSYSIQYLLDQLISLSNLPFLVEVDPERLRPSDVPIFVGDCTKFRERAGWRAEIPLRTSLADTLNYWRLRVKNT